MLSSFRPFTPLKTNLMKLVPSFVVSLLLACSLACAAEEAKPAAAAVAPVKKPDTFMLVDFRSTPNAFAYGTWSNCVAASKEGITLIKGANGKGGCGADCNLSLDDAKYLEIGLAMGVANELPQVQILLEDADGTNATWRVGVSQLVPAYPVWLRVPVAGIKIEKPGSNGVLDLTKIVKWHLQGDYSTEKPAHFLAIALRGRR